MIIMQDVRYLSQGLNTYSRRVTTAAAACANESIYTELLVIMNKQQLIA